MAREKTVYQCSQCDYVASSYLGKCPECNQWGSLTEKTETRTVTAEPKNRRGGALDWISENGLEALPLSKVTCEDFPRFSSGFPEFDRVLGGGILPGSYLLLGGDPGIGKSTLMLQIASKISQPPTSQKVLYIAGEESPYQIKNRADRLGLKTDNVHVLPATDILQVIQQIRTLKPQMVVIDSIQAMYHPELSGTPGSVSQIRECAGTLMGIAKALNTTIVLIGHVTKEGEVSGPKLLEHTVDTVLYFEGDKYRNLRILRTAKNRFGSTQEMGMFEISEDGLSEVSNPSELFLSESSYQNHPGSVIVSAVEGSRPLLVELQALVGQSAYANPRRIANGVETNRLHQIIAVLERRIGLNFSKQDIYINVVGGLHVEDPGADLGIAMAIITSQRNLSMKRGTVVAGEIGLTGEIRPIRNRDSRISEASKIGFQNIVLPISLDRSQKKPAKPKPQSIQLTESRTVIDAIQACLSPEPSPPDNRIINSPQEVLT